jgi:hypothetical protein
MSIAQNGQCADIVVNDLSLRPFRGGEEQISGDGFITTVAPLQKNMAPVWRRQPRRNGAGTVAN